MHISMRKNFSLHICGAILSVQSATVSAHTGHIDVTGGLAGLLHPITGIDHLVTLVTIGLLVTRLHRRVGWQIPAGFLTGLSLGFVAYSLGLAWSGFEATIAVGLLVLGLSVLLQELRRNWALLGLLNLVVAVAHGYVHASESATVSGDWSYNLGIWIGSAVLIGLGVVMGRAVRCNGWGERGFGLVALLLGVYSLA